MNNFFCAAPWRGLHINPRGDVKTCCAGDPNMLGNINDQTIEEILNGQTLREIRQSIKQGLPHRYCINCVQAEKYGNSERNWHNSVNSDFDATAAALDEHAPAIVDVRWNTTCNLSCNYCDPSASSKWAAHKKIPISSNTRRYYDNVCDYLKIHSESIKEVALVGGEPLLLPENNRLLESINDHCIVTVITNASINFETNAIVKKLAGRANVGWSISFDNIQEQFEYVRHGATWNQLEKNLNILKGFFKNNQHWGGIHAVYNVYNATRLVDFTNFARQNEVTIQWQTLFQPNYLDMQYLGPKMVHAARQEIIQLLDLNICTLQEQQYFEQVLSNLRVNKINQINKFQQHISDIENKYHIDQKGQFERLWPELKFLLDRDE
jgi:radical SAM protein with 4Fe4S-binding SPASM domain